MGQSQFPPSRVNYERGIAFGRQGPYKTAIAEFEKALTYSPPPELEMSICYNYALCIEKGYQLRDSLTFELYGEQVEQAAKVIELCDRATRIYRTKFETGATLTDLPVRETCELAEDLRLRTQMLKPHKESKGCFIATAAYGTEMAPEIEILRRYRNERLLSSALGVKSVMAYYKIAPPIAAYIDRSMMLRWLVRNTLVKPFYHYACFCVRRRTSRRT